MYQNSLVRWIVVPMAIVAVGGLIGRCAVAAESNAVAAHMDTYTAADGVNHFALSVKPGADSDAGTRDVVVLFNTSASQQGEYRKQAMDTLKATLAGLKAGDRVRLVAVDLNAVPLTKTFVAPNGSEIADALAALEARVPLGSTDISKALTAVLESYDAGSKNLRAAVYIGDGRSAAHLLQAEELGGLAAKLADARIPVSSFAVGARTDLQLLGVLAVQTGGDIITDFANDKYVKGTKIDLTRRVSDAEVGKRLAAAADATVLWPTSVKWPTEMTEVYPKRMTPLRTDRETIVVGTFKGTSPIDAQLNVESAAGPKQLAVQATPTASDKNNYYLPRLVEWARASGDVPLPLVGAAGLRQAEQAIAAGMLNLQSLARQAIVAGDYDSAEKLLGEALRQAPNDAASLSLKKTLAKHKQDAATKAVPAAAPAAASAPAAGDADLNLVGPAAEPPAGTLAEGFQYDRRVVTQAVTAEVHNILNRVRTIMNTDPETATQDLRDMLEKVRKTEELEPGVRDQFVTALETALRETASRKVVVEQNRQMRQENAATLKERELINKNLNLKELKVTQLLERSNALIAEGSFKIAEETVLEQAQKEMPSSPVIALATLEASANGAFSDFMATRLARQKGAVAALLECEKSQIPFPGDPPIVYPDAEYWQQLSARRIAKYSNMDLKGEKASEKKIQDALNSPATLQFSEIQLSDVIAYLKEAHKIEIYLDDKPLGEASITKETPITEDIKGISLRSALRLMLKKIGATFIIKNEVLMITTPEEADNSLVTKVYPVADLVVPIVNQPYGGMGGMMGGGSSMGGGMMGGMGGSSGGGGMGGGMGGGGGMFNVRDSLDDVAKDVAKDTAKKDAPKKNDKPTEKSEQAKAVFVDGRPAKIDLGVIEKNGTPSVAWEQYFSKNQPQPRAVRDAARQLMRVKKFDQVVALVNAALRHGQVQPWMYETLARTLDVTGQPPAEVERALMSAADFIDNAVDLTYLGTHLAQLGFHDRALQVYRQAANLDPIRPEPYIFGLRSAKATDNLEGMKWASLGILGQAWPKEHTSVWQAGLGVSRQVLDQLRKEKRDKEAVEFEAAIAGVMQRDCVVVVSYTGDAEIDVLVGEPSGTMCSLRNSRTTAGGILLSDDTTQVGRDGFGGHCQAYVCPRGFDGTYKVLLRRIWGNITTGKVNVEVVTHCNTNKAISVSKKISMAKDEALVVFDLKNGRRTESLQEQQVASAVTNHAALSQAILAQQISAATDSGAVENLVLSRARSALAATTNSNGTVQSAVGYQPVIITLPAGAQFQVTAVISADRRYVRVTPSPVFSGISEVNTFNTTTGAGSASSGSGSSGYSGSF